MQFGAVLPNVGDLAQPDILVELAQQAERLGFGGVFLSDHIALPVATQSKYPYRSDGAFPLRPQQNVLEPVVALSFLAASTRRVKLGFSVLVLPYRQPVLNAKMLSSLDVFSRGRLIVGAGAGWLAEEFAALGASFAQRGAVTDEHIRLLRECWQNDEVNFSGKHYTVSGVAMRPQPAQLPGPPIWTGGITEAALRRAARLADGWQAIRMRPPEIAQARSRLAKLREQYGNLSGSFTVALRAGLDITDTALPETRAPLRGSSEQVKADAQAYAEAGLDWLLLEPHARSATEFVSQLDRFRSLGLG